MISPTHLASNRYVRSWALAERIIIHMGGAWAHETGLAVETRRTKELGWNLSFVGVVNVGQYQQQNIQTAQSWCKI